MLDPHPSESRDPGLRGTVRGHKVFSMAAEMERGLISARTKEVLRARRASGLPVGRPKGPGKSKLDKHRPEIEALLANGSTQKFIAKRYNSSPANLANWLKKRGIKKPKL